MALIYPQNSDLTESLKSARKKVPQSARLSAGGGGGKTKKGNAQMPPREFEWGFPNCLQTVDHPFDIPFLFAG